MVEQVGGTHYSTGEGQLQHWDVVANNGIGYLVGCASKYVSRHRFKLGRQDVEKGISYLKKAIETQEKISVDIVWGQVKAWAQNVPKMSYRDYVAIDRMFRGDHEFAISILELILEQDYDATPKDRGRARTTDPEPAIGTSTDTERLVPRRVSLAPWQVDKNYKNRFAIGRDLSLFTLFWKQVSSDIWRLESVVVSGSLPRELQMQYDLHMPSNKWTLKMSQVPSELRDYYPHLQQEMNLKEFQESPEEFRHMYTVTPDGKHVLLSMYVLWGRD